MKKILSFLLVLTMVMSVSGVAFAEGDVASVTKSDGTVTNYDTLAAAIKAASSGDTVKLLKSGTFAELFGQADENGTNYTANNRYHITTSGITIDLSGNSITDIPNYTLQLEADEITLKNGTLEAAKAGSDAAYTYGVNSGYVSYALATETGKGIVLDGLTVTGGISVSNSEATLRNMTVHGTNYYAVCSQAGGVVKIESGTYDKITADNYNSKSLFWIEGAGTDNDASPAITYGDSQLIISGGTFTTLDNGTLVNKDQDSYQDPVITGGTFKGSSDNTLDVSTYFPAGAALTQNESGQVIEDTAKTENAAAEVGGVKYATLAEAVAAAKRGETVTLLMDVTLSEQLAVNGDITLDLGGFTLTSTYSNTDSQVNYAISVANNASLTIKNGTLDSTAAGGVTIAGGCTVTVEKDATVKTIKSAVRSTAEGGATFNVYGTINSEYIGILSNGKGNVVNVDGATITSKHFGVYQNGSCGGATITVKNSTVTDTVDVGVYVSNSATKAASEGMQTLTIENSKITGPTAVEVKFTNVTVKGDETELTATGDPVSLTPNSNGAVAVGYALAVTHNGTDKTKDSASGTVTYEGGKAIGLVNIQPANNDQEAATTISITGGLFSDDISNFVADGYLEIDYDGGELKYAVVPATAAGVVPDVTEPEVESTIPNGTPGKDKADAAAETVQTDGVLSAAAVNTANSIEESDANTLKTEATTGDNALTPAAGETITLYAQTYLDVKATGVKTDESSNVNEITLNITPMVQIVASTAANSAGVILKTEDPTNGNAVVVRDADKLNIDTPSVITVTLPDLFKGQTVYITHVKESTGKTYYYEGKADDSGKLTFTSQHGFCPFIFSLSAPAKITPTSSSRDSITVRYLGANDFGTSKSAKPDRVEIDGVSVPFYGDGSRFTVSSISPNARWITVHWGSTSVTVNFTPDGQSYSNVVIPKTGDMPIWAAIAAFLGF